MKLPFSWLKEHAPINASADEVARRLVRLGHEVEGIDTPRANVEGVVVGQILSKKPHPNADRLSLLTVDIGGDAPLAIVCGARNMEAGDKVPVATIGTCLPNGLKIKKGKIRGEVSFGMCCSAAELGLAEDAEGLMILPQEAPVGMGIGEYLGLEEAVFDLSITPNRGDCMSARGIARELAADFGVGLAQVKAVQIAVDDAVEVPNVHVHDGMDCPCYMARRIDGLQLGEAPEWMRRGLIQAGMRPVNGVVDVLNYVMLYLGQPMHAFDAASLRGDLHVRRAQSGESIEALDGRIYSLGPDDLVIADANGAVAMAGMIGGEASGVRNDTCSIILESAYFLPATISRSRRHHGLVSEASMRFERGVDPAMIEVAMEQATKILLDLYGGRAGRIVRVGNATSINAGRVIRCLRSDLESRLGVALPSEIDGVLQRMEFEVHRDGNAMRVGVPAFRHDVALPEDLAEEYARILGYDAIPVQMPPLVARSAGEEDTALHDAVAGGAVQAITYAFISERGQRDFVPEDGKDLRLSNPIAEEMNVMRRSLWPGLLQAARHNMNRQQPGVFLVEHGRIYEAGDGCHHEHRMLGWLLCGEVARDEWYARAREADFFDLKGAIEDWLAAWRLSARFVADDAIQGLQPGQAARIVVGKRAVGCLGRIDRAIAERYDLESPVFGGWIDLDLLPAGKRPKFVELPEFPSVQRDLVMLFEQQIQAESIVQTAARVAGQLLVEGRIFDVYRGAGIPEGKRSIGLRLILQDPSKTLTQDEADAVVARVVDALREQLGGELR